MDSNVKFKKAAKNLKNDMIVLMIIEIIIFLFTITKETFNFFSIIFLALSFAGYCTAKKESANAGALGIIVGLLMMCSIFFLDLIDTILGLFVLLHAIKYNKLFNERHPIKKLKKVTAKKATAKKTTSKSKK